MSGAHLEVDRRRDVLGVVAPVAHVAAHEHLAGGLAELDRAEPGAHAELRDHLAGRRRRLLDVVAGARRRVVEHELLGDAPAHRVGQRVQQLVAGGRVLVLGRHDHRVPEGPAARQDRHLGDRVGVPERGRDQGVTALVVRGDLDLLGVHDPRALLRSRDDAVDRLVQRVVRDGLLAGAGGEQRGLVEHVGQVGTGEPGGAAGDDVQVDVRRHRLALRVHREDPLAALEVGRVHGDLAVEAARAQQRGVEDVGAVGGRDEDDVRVDVEAVHLDEHLVERLLALVVPAAHAGAAVAADGVDLVDEDDRRGVLLGLVEQVTDAAGADADEHLDEVRAGDRVERHARLTGDRAGEQRLAGPGRAVQQHALGDLGADGLELGRLREELLDLLELLDRLVDTRDVRERDLRGLLVDQLGLRLAEAHDARAAALHVRHQEPEDGQDDDQREDEARGGWPTTTVCGTTEV